MKSSRERGLSETLPPSLDMIKPNLYLAGIMEVVNIDALKRHNITHILTVNSIPLPEYVIQVCPHLTVKFIMKDDLSNSDLLSHFDETYKFIEDGLSQGAVVVHCMMGMSRSATIVIAYLMKKHKLSYKKAVALVGQKRTVFPNTGFIEQLKKYEELGYNTTSVS